MYTWETPQYYLVGFIYENGERDWFLTTMENDNEPYNQLFFQEWMKINKPNVKAWFAKNISLKEFRKLQKEKDKEDRKKWIKENKNVTTKAITNRNS